MSAGDWRPGDPWSEWRPVEGRLELRSVGACEREEWSLLSWPQEWLDSTTGELLEAKDLPSIRPFWCGSWRCRRCARWRGAVDWSRCREAVLSRDWWVLLVLTFDPSHFRDRWEAYRAAGACWDRHLRESLRRRAGRLAYLQTWEAHVSGWPHVNLLLSSPELRAWVEASGLVELEREGPEGRRRRCVLPRAWRRWVRDAAVRAGFGPVVWVEVVSRSNPAALAGYLVKLANELVGAGSKKGEQSPMDAPRHFRRIRASRGLLPKPYAGRSREGWTGALARWRSVETAHPARKTGEVPPRRDSTWAAVHELIRSEAERSAQAWGDLA